MRARQALGFARPTLLAVGNLVPLKRHRLMIEALAQLPDVELVIAGEGPERAALERLAGERRRRRPRPFARPRAAGPPARNLQRGRSPCCWSRPARAGPTCCWKAWPAAPRSSSPICRGSPISSAHAEAGRILAEVTPSRLAAAVRDAPCCAAAACRQPAAMPSNSTGRARPKAKSRCFIRFCSGTPDAESLLMVQDAAIDLGIAGHAVRPRALGVDELDRARPDARPGFPIGERRKHAFGERAGRPAGTDILSRDRGSAHDVRRRSRRRRSAPAPSPRAASAASPVRSTASTRRGKTRRSARS